MKGTLRAMFVVTALALVGCSGAEPDDEPDDVPGLDRIDGPAQVDPSYNPMQIDPSAPDG